MIKELRGVVVLFVVKDDAFSLQLKKMGVLMLIAAIQAPGLKMVSDIVVGQTIS